MSEYNDFGRPAEDDVWQACMRSVATCDYYILLIGSNRGSWYDRRRRLTVTRQEFRVAAEASLKRPLGIFAFVRKEVRSALSQWEADGKPRKRSPLLKDPRFTAEFIAEVERPASPGRGPRWVNRFDDFRDLVDALRGPLKLQTDFERRLLEENLLRQVLGNLSSMVTRGGGGIAQSTHGWATRARDTIAMDELRLDGAIWLSEEQISGLGFLYTADPRDGLRVAALDDSIARGLYLEVDSDSGAFVDTVEHKSLLALREDMRRLESLMAGDGLSAAKGEILSLARQANRGQLSNGASLGSVQLALLLSYHDRLDDLFKAQSQLVAWMIGSAPSPEIERRPISPVQGFTEQIEADRMGEEELRWAIQNQVIPFGPKLTPGSRKIAKKTERAFFDELRKTIPPDVMSDVRLRERISKTFDTSVVTFTPVPKTTLRARRNR